MGKTLKFRKRVFTEGSSLPIQVKFSHRKAWLLTVSGSVLSFPCILASTSVKNPFWRFLHLSQKHPHTLRQ